MQLADQFAAFEDQADSIQKIEITVDETGAVDTTGESESGETTAIVEEQYKVPDAEM